jgi:ATP-dependent DNA ligase
VIPSNIDLILGRPAYLGGELCGIGDDGLPSFSQSQAAGDGSRGVPLVYFPFDLPHLDGHETGDGELIRKHAGQLGHERVVSKKIDAPYAPGNRGLWRK